MTWVYVCSDLECGNEIPATQVDSILEGSAAPVVVTGATEILCENIDGHRLGGTRLMLRQQREGSDA